MGTKRTPGPWKIEEEGACFNVSCEGMPRHMLLAGMTSQADGEHKANAKFIVKACNMHDEFVGMCEEMTESICNMCKRLNLQHEHCTSCQEMDGYKAVLQREASDG